MMTNPSNLPTNKKDETLRVFLLALEAVSHLPDGKEIIGKGHIICHNAWFQKRIEEPGLNFREAAKLYCPGKASSAVITVWNGEEAVSHNQTGHLSDAQKQKLEGDLNAWFRSKGLDSQSIAIN